MFRRAAGTGDPERRGRDSLATMRLWSLHPALLDRAALVACWREALLAQKVLAGETTGYTRHPQLERFRAADEPATAIAAFLDGLATEATRRGYRFDRERIRESAPFRTRPIAVTDGQLAFEWAHLRAKTARRSPEWDVRLATAAPRAHPLFVVVPGPVADWERAA